MANLVPTCQRVGAIAWRYSWSGTGPFLLRSPDIFTPSEATTETSRILEWGPLYSDTGEPPILEVLDAAGTTADFIHGEYPNQMRMQWRASTFADMYVVQNYSTGSSAWADVRTFPESGAGYYFHETSGLAHGSSASFRVLAKDLDGNESNPLPFAIDYWVTVPGAPRVQGTYSSRSGLLTISARA